MGVAKQKQDRRLEVFEDAYTMWTERRLTQAQAQAQAAELLGVCERTFRRWVVRHREDADGDVVEALRDRRLSRAPHRAAPVDEVMRMVDEYRVRMVAGREVGTDRDDGRRHQRGPLDVLLRGGRPVEQLSGHARGD